MILELDQLIKEKEEKKKNSSSQTHFQPHFDYIIGESRVMHDLYKKIANCADTTVPVLIRGENGTGKELVARALHGASSRKNKTFVIINCSAIPEALIESELFGHKKGSFTGAVSDKIGKFEEAKQGTIFLDEIGTLSPDLQVKLLRTLQPDQDGKYTVTPVGSNKSIELDVRLITATNEDLEEAIKNKTFREDLFHRINVISLTVPPLSKRENDLVLLSQYFLDKAKIRHQKDKYLSPQAMDRLISYSWPGNVRELQNMIERAVILSEEDKIQAEDFLINIDQLPNSNPELDLNKAMEQFEVGYLKQVLERCQGNHYEAAKLLDIPLNILRSKLSKYQLGE